MNQLSEFFTRTSIRKQLYTIFGILSLLIIFQLVTLYFVSDSLSATRALIEGSSYWSKAQKDALNSLHSYIVSRDPSYYQEFKEHLKVHSGDRLAREQLESPSPDMSKVYQGLLEGRNHLEDLDGMIRLLNRFSGTTFIQRSFQKWRESDILLDDIVKEGEDIHRQILAGKEIDIHTYFNKLNRVNKVLTHKEDQFTQELSKGSRQLEDMLWAMVVILTLMVGVICLFLTATLNQRISKSLNSLTSSAEAVGQGDFSEIESHPPETELARLSHAFNEMVISLKNSVLKRKEAEQHSQIKDLFLANMSHEIRTPLSVILGYTHLLESNSLTPEQRDNYFNTIFRSGEDLNEIINDILDISKVESGQLKIRKQTFSLPHLLEDIKNSVHIKAEEKGVEFKVKVAQGTPDIIGSDINRIKQVLLNLINNAIKCTHDGKVQLSVFSSGQKIYFDVKDNGIGIAEADKTKIFELFNQGSIGIPEGKGGVGLGLPLSKKLANLLGGNLVLIKSKPGKGSHFRFTIAYDPSESQAKEKSNDQSLEIQRTKKRLDKKILVVEDTPELRELVRILLEQWNFNVDMASNGREAIDMIHDRNYNVVLMDVQMPVMDGPETVKHLRDEGFNKPIIALTAHAMEKDKIHYLEQGYTDYIAKPIEADQLLEKILSYS